MQLSAYENVTPENVKFTEAKEFKVKDSDIKYKRIPIYGKIIIYNISYNIIYII